MKEIRIDPLTRIEGHMGVRVIVDEKTGKPIPGTERCYSTMFRGFEIIVRGRKVEDAIHITSRICGVCGATHALSSAYAADMALGVTPEPLGVALRNMAYGMADNIYDHSLILNMLGGPDYSSQIVGSLTPSVYSEAKATLAPNRSVHGYTRISDIMDALQPLKGKIWRMTIKYQRLAREAAVLIWGRHSHPSTLIPGGIMTDLTNFESLLLEYAYRLISLTAWAKYVAAIWNDLSWFYREHAGYGEQGLTCIDPDCKRYPLLFSAGLYDDPETYSSLGSTPQDIYSRIDENAQKRIIKPGFVAQGASLNLLEENITEYNVGVMEKVDHSFYKNWDNIYTDIDYLGKKLLRGIENPKWHPWNKLTIPKPEERDWTRKYSWTTTVRYVSKDGRIVPVELGPIARLAATSLHSYSIESPSMSLKAGNGRIELTLPPSRGEPDLPPGVYEEMTLEYRAPPKSTTIDRVWARAFDLALDVASMWWYMDWILRYAKKGGETKTSRWTLGSYPEKMSFGWGAFEAPRGTVSHWIVQEKGRIVNYQLHAPTTINLSPSDNNGSSPFESSVRSSVVTEELPSSQWQGLDFVRAIRSFDPCLSCSVHIQFVGSSSSRIVERKILPTCTI